MKIQPSAQGKYYELWNLNAMYLLYPLNNTLGVPYERGFRANTIVNCWGTIESFTRCALHNYALRNFKDLDLDESWKVKYSCIELIQRLFKGKETKDYQDFVRNDELHQQYLHRIEEAAWKDLKFISKEVGLKLSATSIDHDCWEFLKHLYSLRNGFMHGVTIKIIQSNSPHLQDEITNKYFKAIKYLDKSKVINQANLIATQSIDLILNKKVTDYIINKTIDCLDCLSTLYDNTFPSRDWKMMRQAGNSPSTKTKP